MVGVDQIVKLAEKNDGVCKWHLGSYRKKGTPAVKPYLAVAAAAGGRGGSNTIALCHATDRAGVL